MDRKEELISRIVEIEWQMFQGVSNIGGQAGCQQDHVTFEIMRSSQSMGWSEATLESYLDDLLETERTGRNLLTEKYARMMERTSPLEYAGIKHLLPPLAPEVPPLIDEITTIVLEWEKELLHKYPYILKRGRPINSSEDTPFVTSIETYLRGELATYSPRTLGLYRDNVLKLKDEGINGSEIILEHTMKRYGFGSLEDAHNRLKAQSSGHQANPTSSD
ncbi:MAG: DUF4125 family protein [Dehalococcoidia bacterium]